MKSTPSTNRLRSLSAGLGVALLSGALAASAAPAQALVVEETGHTITGSVTTLDANGVSAAADGAFIDLYLEPYADGDLPWDEAESAPDGTFEVLGVEDGEYSIDVYLPDDDEFVAQSIPFTVSGADVVIPTIELKTALDVGTLEVTGSSVVGKTLTVLTDGWPAGATLHYQWGYSTGQSGGPIDGATSATYTITADHIGHMLSVFVTATKPGFEASQASLFSDEVVTAPKKPAAPAPVADSDGLASYLVGKGSTPQPQDSVGLPSGSLNPAKGYEASVPWLSPDSFVDVYLYSTPVFVGTFPVVDGVVQITLSADLLSELAAGGHTLVVLGQSSGAVSSVTVSIAAMLASTGVDPVAAFAASGVFLLLGGLSLVAARRIRSKA
ncbi:hypothetical protein ACFFGH_19565 [Lysobacter korlensis]|uniref:Carboxypeptidase regulatory-like domain-containing protein n=1 Tax=Lysobacter korlensis TaxID=553636 RepID=A0ABV6RST1_9GAMM